MIPLFPAILGDETDSLSVDSANVYFEDLTDLLSLRLFTLTKSNTLEIISPPQGRIILKPNGNTGLGMGFNYKFIGLALSYGLPTSQSRIDKYGKTNSFDVQVSFFGKRIGMDAYLQEYKGFLAHLKTAEDMYSWRTLAKEPEFTLASVVRFIDSVSHNSATFRGFQMWKKGNFVGDEAHLFSPNWNE